MDHNGGRGICARASGYTTNASPGPEIQAYSFTTNANPGPQRQEFN